jgi:hypothetical protein
MAGSVQLSKDGKVIRVHPIRHDRARELGAFTNPKVRPTARTPRSAMSASYRNSDVAQVPGLDTPSVKRQARGQLPGQGNRRHVPMLQASRKDILQFWIAIVGAFETMLVS